MLLNEIAPSSKERCADIGVYDDGVNHLVYKLGDALTVSTFTAPEFKRNNLKYDKYYFGPSFKASQLKALDNTVVSIHIREVMDNLYDLYDNLELTLQSIQIFRKGAGKFYESYVVPIGFTKDKLIIVCKSGSTKMLKFGSTLKPEELKNLFTTN